MVVGPTARAGCGHRSDLQRGVLNEPVRHRTSWEPGRTRRAGKGLTMPYGRAATRDPDRACVGRRMSNRSIAHGSPTSGRCSVRSGGLGSFTGLRRRGRFDHPGARRADEVTAHPRRGDPAAGAAQNRPPAPSCPKRPFATHADRLRPRLQDRRLPVAGPAARRPAGRGHRRRGQPLPRLRLRRTRRPAGLDSCLRALRKGDVLVVWKLDRLGRNLAHLVNTVQDLSARGVGLRVLAGQGAQIDTTTAAGRLVFGIFAALAEFERELDPGTHPGRAQGCPGSRAQGRQEVRAVEGPGAAGPGCDGPPRHVSVRAVP